MLGKAEMGGDSCGPGTNGYPSDCEVTQGLRERSESGSRSGQRSYAWRSNLARAAKIKLLLLDVDGVLTDSSIIYLPGGVETKAFSTKDGLGIRLLQKAGVEVGIITARRSEVVQRRAENLGITILYQGAGAKREVYERILAEQGLAPEQVAYVGDDWLDVVLVEIDQGLEGIVDVKQKVGEFVKRCAVLLQGEEEKIRTHASKPRIWAAGIGL